MAHYLLAWTGMFASVKTKLACWSRAAGQHPVWLISFGLAAVTLAIYGPVISFDFVEFDDPDYVTSNGAVQRGLSFEGVLWAFRGFHVGNYHRWRCFRTCSTARFSIWRPADTISPVCFFTLPMWCCYSC